MFRRIPHSLALALALLFCASSVLFVCGGRVFGYTDVSCSRGETSASFVSGTCYPSAPGSVMTSCYINNESLSTFAFQIDSTDQRCGVWLQTTVGYADGTCYPVRVGNIGSIRVLCSEAIMHAGGCIGWIVALGLTAALSWT